MKLFYKLAYRLIQIYWRLTRPITVGVRLLLITEGAIYLVKHTYDGAWHLPGGGLKRGETLEQAIRREAVEEAGAVLETLALFGVYSSFWQAKSDHVVVFISHRFTLHQAADRGEIEQAAFFALDDLPPQASWGTHRRIAEYRQDQGPYYGSW